MKRIFSLLALTLLAVACTTGKPSSKNTPAVMTVPVETLIPGVTADVIPGLTGDLQRGVDQCAALWRPEDGTQADFEAFVKQWLATTPEARKTLFDKISRALEIFSTQANQLTIELGRPTVLAEGEPGEIDYLLSSHDASAHFSDDMFASKVAFITILNFPHYTLEEKNALGPGWDRLQWAYARLGDVFTERIPAEVSQAVTIARSAAEGYVDTYNIRMGHLLTEEGERLFPEEMSLLSHWNLRDELKSNYADVPHAHEKQELIYKVMERIVTQEIPAAVVNNPEYDWAPVSNKVWKDGKEVSLPAEGDVRYGHILSQFHAYQELDRWCPAMPTAITRNFEGSIELTDQEVEDMFIRFVTAPQVARVAALIKERLENDATDYLADVEFHVNLAYASHNTIFAAMLNYVNSLILELRMRFFEREEYHGMTAEAHRRIYEAVKARDEELAVYEMGRHLRIIENYEDRE